MQNKAKMIISLSVLVAAAYIFFVLDGPYKEVADDKVVKPTASDMIHVATPTINFVVTSPAVVSGEARGTWFFEASFPVDILGADGTLLGQAPAQAQSDWMTEDFVPFAASVPFDPKGNASGIIRFKKDNPSGDPARDAHFDVPVLFKVR